MRDSVQTIPGVGITEKDPEQTYAGFNRRMIAATIDSLLVMLPFGPAIDWLLDKQYGAMIASDTVVSQISIETDPQRLMALYRQLIIESGVMHRSLENMALQTLVIFIASAVCWHFWSATPGKILLGCKVVDAETFAPITMRQTMLRLLGYLISGACIFFGFFWIGLNKKRRGWHDYIASTVVIRVLKKPK